MAGYRAWQSVKPSAVVRQLTVARSTLSLPKKEKKGEGTILRFDEVGWGMENGSESHCLV